MRKNYIVLTILSVIEVFISLILPYYSGAFVDILIYQPNMKSILYMSIFIMFVGVVEAIFSFVYNLVSIKMLNKITYIAKMQLVEHIRRISFLTIQKLNPVYLNQRINVDILAVFQFFMENYITVILMIMALVVECSILFRMSVVLGTIVIGFIPIYVVIYTVLRAPLYRSNLDNKEQQNIFFNKMNEQFTLLKTIKANADFETQNKKLERYFERYIKTVMKYSKISCIFTSCDSTIALLFRTIVYIVAGYEIVGCNLTVGEFTTINIYLGMIINQVKYFFNLGKKYQDAKTSFDRILELYNIPEEINGKIKLLEIGNIQLKEIKFSYDDSNQNLYKNRGIIRMCERVAASGGTPIPYSA